MNRIAIICIGMAALSWLAPISPVLARPGATPSPTAASVDEVATLILEQANKTRVQQGLPALKLDPRLAEAATGHSKDMAARKYFDHDSPEGVTMEKRVAKVGINPKGADEILFRCSARSAAKVAEASLEAWLKDDAHRATLLNPRLLSAGVGVALGGGEFIVTMDFDCH